ncbi:MAG TPA: hypothetical protein VFP05_05015 [Thermomicrobiales bacterium]|nr:hypothetical protein [Thermomicrobiales bacterium]
MTRSITVAPGQSMSEVLNALKIGAGDELVIDIPADASVLLTANEFRALSIAAERDDVEVSIYTEDPLRRQLAMLFGVPLVNEIPQPQPYVAPELEPVAETEAFAPTGDEDREEGELESDAVPVRSRGGSSGSFAKPLGALVAIATFVAIGIGLYWLFFSSMTVELHLTRQKVASTLAYNVTEPGVAPDSVSGGGIVIEGEPVEFTLSRSLTVPATGQTVIPDKAAAGEVTLRNPADSSVTIQKGTEFEGFNGVTYAFSEAVEVPAASNGQPGETTGKISSPGGGEAGNQGIGMLTGELPNGVYYSNRMGEISGGTQKTATTVSQADIDQLRTEIDKELLALATTTELDKGLLLVPSTVTPVAGAGTATPDEGGYVFSQNVGDEASEISVTANVTFAAIAYDPTELTAAAIPQLEGEVAQGQTFDPDSVRVNTPAETNHANGVISLLATVAGDAIPSLDDATKAALADQLAGKSDDEVNRILAGLDYADDSTVTFSPSWLPERVPSSSGRITIETS